MAYTLDEFCAESRALLKAQPLTDALPQMAERLGGSCPIRPSSPKPSATTCRPAGASSITIPKLDFYVLAHVQEGGKTGKPHSHGSVMGDLRQRREHHRDDRVAPRQPGERGPRRTRAGEQISPGPGQTSAYGPGVIHSTAHPEKAWVIRVTGTDLDKLPRYHFRKQDRMLEKA